MPHLPMNAEVLLDALIERGIAQAIRGPSKVVRTVVLEPIRVEIAFVANPDETGMRARWKERVGSAAIPYLVIADDPDHQGLVLILGPSQPDAPIRSVETDRLIGAFQQACQRSYLEGIRHLAEQVKLLDQSGSRIRGIQIKGMLTNHTLKMRLQGAPGRWQEFTEVAERVTRTDHWRTLLAQLGYQVERRPQRGWVVRCQGQPVAIVHAKADPDEFARLDSEGRPPEGLLVQDCHSAGAAYGILVHRGRFRLFDSRSATATAEWLDIDSEMLTEDDFPFLALLAPPFLADGGLTDLQEEARAFGASLHKRLDHTIRQNALPALARGLGYWADENGWDIGNDKDRLELERASLTLIFRLMFILYAESSGFLPTNNRTYRRVSLTSLVEEAVDTQEKLSSASTALWTRFETLTNAMRAGNPAWEVPAYNGSLFAEKGFEGAELLAQVKMADPDFAEVLIAVGKDSQAGYGVDYSTLEIGHLGHIYEALLSLRLSVTIRPLRYDHKKDRYIPADAEAEIKAGSLLWQTNEGGRKAGGVYYTPAELVRHLVEGAVVPAFERHLEEVRRIAKTDPAYAARELLRFSVLDPACGSAHFLVQVVETLAEATVRFLAETPLPGITEAVDRLRAGATLGMKIDDVALLRRLLLKHCVFGVDVSPMGAEIAAISLWLASFVPGLSLSYLKRNIVVGNSLIGVVDPTQIRRRGSLWDDRLHDALEEATKAASRLASIDDRTPEEYEASLAADSKAQAATEGLKRLFDLWTAEGFGLPNARVEAENYSEAIIDGQLNDDRRVLVDKATALSRTHSFLHWPLAFPGVFSGDRPGFDVVVGNPPWKEVKVRPLSFYTLYQPGLQGLPRPSREKTINALLRRRPDIAIRLKEERNTRRTENNALKTGLYEPMSGSPDLYKFFCQRYRFLIRRQGYFGVVLPRGTFINEGSKGFRNWLFTKTDHRRIDFLLNTRKWAFDMEARFTVALVVAQHLGSQQSHSVELAGVARNPEEWQRQSGRPGHQLALASLVVGNITPLFRSQDEIGLFSKMSGTRFPYGPGNRWRCFPVSEVSSHVHLDKDKSEYAVWIGESFDQYSPHGKGSLFCAPDEALWAKIKKQGKRYNPGQGSVLASLASKTERQRAVLNETRRARVAYRKVSRATDSRTVRACLVPPNVLLYESAFYLAFLDGSERSQAVCIGILNSLPFDWQVRRLVEVNLNFFLLEALKVPDLGGSHFEAIGCAAARLSAVDGRFAGFASANGVKHGALDPAETMRLLVDIDARVARAWQLTPFDLEVMFEDFTINAVSSSYRSALIARLKELS